MRGPLRVLVADDHPLFLFALAHSVSRRDELEVVARAASGGEAIDALLAHRPDLAVLDVQMADIEGLAVLRAATAAGLAVRVLFISGAIEPAIAYELLEAGAAGIVSKAATPEEIGDALVRIAAGETVLGSDVQHIVVSAIRGRRDGDRPRLSGREADVLHRIARGLSGPEIAAELRLSLSTVKTHQRRLYERLGVSDRAAAVSEAMRRGLIE
ncbi:response regulator [Solirubrobacter soli]|uniref:response regulator n=1 Tax=Solirubrobacter soli TaxID=363832 RepID=UPI00055EC64C|nr:response regulator transcription factor [Solirubrobacter soli]